MTSYPLLKGQSDEKTQPQRCPDLIRWSYTAGVVEKLVDGGLFYGQYEGLRNTGIYAGPVAAGDPLGNDSRHVGT